MRSLYAFVSFAVAVSALPQFLVVNDPPSQIFPVQEESEVPYNDFGVDLEELRLVQFEGQEPVWMTELEKVSHSNVIPRSY